MGQIEEFVCVLMVGWELGGFVNLRFRTFRKKAYGTRITKVLVWEKRSNLVCVKNSLFSLVYFV